MKFVKMKLKKRPPTIKYPKVEFKISTREEMRVFLDFLRDRQRDSKRFLRWLIRPHPGFSKVLKGRRKDDKKISLYVRHYVIDYYRRYGNEIRMSREWLKTEWRKKEKTFFHLTDRIFHGHHWPQGRYIGYLTIWDVYPRYLNQKTFQVPYKHRIKNYALIVAAHEMLHFIFYDYLWKSHPEFRKAKYDKMVWEISEVFNAAVQGSKKWVKAFGAKPFPYPEQRPLISRVSKLWNPDNGIEAFFDTTLRRKISHR